MVAEKSARHDLEKEIESLRAQVTDLQSKEMNPSAFARVLMKKIRQTKDFGLLMAEMCSASTNVGIHTALVNIQTKYPELKLRKKELGWGPYADNRVDLLQQRLYREERNFAFVEALSERQEPVSLEQLETMSANYDSDLDKPVGVTPDEYVCEDDDNSGTSHENPGPTNNQASS